jgi:cytochrome P450
MSACPIKETTINFIKTNKNVLTYKRNISISLFIVSYFLLTYIASHCLKISNLPLLIFSLLNAFFSFYISFIIYEKSIQNIFSSISLSNKKRMPKYSFFNLLYDIIIRKSTLLRDMDIERMKKFGNIYLMFMGYRPAIVITSSDLAKKVSKKIDIYAKSNPIDLNMPYFYKWVGNNNIVLSNGSDWKRLRKIIHKQLTATNVYFPTMCKKALELTEHIKKTIKYGVKSEIFLNRWLKAFSLDIAGETLFGFNFNHLKELTNAAIEAMDYIISEIFNPLRVAFPLVNRLPTKTNKKLDRSIQYIDNLVSIMRDKYSHNNLIDVDDNLLKRLINSNKEEKLTEDELRNNIITLVLSSYETTQVSLGGALYHLARYSEYQKLIRDESKKLFPNIDQEMMEANDFLYEKFQKFELLENFILESLRIYSPLANQNARTITQDTQLGGFNIKSDISLIINIHAIHMNDDSWNEPNKFNPYRFCKENRHDKFSFLPFGAGPRLCSGRNFTLLEQKIAICCLLRKFEISLPCNFYNVPIKRTSFTGIPENSFTLLFEPL